MSATGLVLQIERFAVHDGPGIRVAVFLKGCPLRCWWCHSPESQHTKPELILRTDRCIVCGSCAPACTHDAIVKSGSDYSTLRERCATCGDCTELCPTGAREVVGQPMTVAALLAEIEKDRVFMDRSGGGVTFSGGEPLMQPAFLAEALDACRTAGLHTAVETAGYAPWTAMQIAARADLVFFDLKVWDDERHQQATGVSNRRILDNFVRLTRDHHAVRARLPLVPGVNDDDANVSAIGGFVSHHGVRDIDVLPYHRAGLAKYERLNRANPHVGLEPPTDEALGVVRRRLENFGLTVHIGEAL